MAELARATPNAPEISDPYRHWIAIVGMGAAGTSLFTALIDRAETHDMTKDIGFLLVDARPKSEFGRGIAWSSSQFDGVRANMRLHTIGFKKPLLDKLCKAAGLSQIDDPKSLADDFLFHQRKLIGNALHDEFEEYLKKAESNDIPVILESASVDDITRFHRGFSVHYRTQGQASGQRFADFVVLGLGNVPNYPLNSLRGIENYIFNPWDWENYKTIPSGSKAAVIGLGPTGVDSILMLMDSGAGSVVGYSPSGRLQYPRPHNIPYTLTIMSESRLRSLVEISLERGKIGITYEELFNMLTLEFLEARACEEWQRAVKNSKLPPRQALLKGLLQTPDDSKWYSVLKALDPITPFIWNALTPEAKQQYLRDLRHDHTNLSYGMASVQARRLGEYLDQKKLQVLGGYKKVEHDGKSFVVTRSAENTEVTESFDVVVNCTGIGSNIQQTNSRLVKSLYEKKWLLPHPDGGARVDFETGQVLNENAKAIGGLYSLVGSLTYGTHLLTHCLWQVWQSADRTADSITRALANRCPRVD